MKLQQNRYLWVYVAGMAAVPLLLDFCLAGLASAGPALPYGGQFWAIALFGITPSLAMQWLKPFYVFSLPPLALRPDALKEDQRRCLRLFQSWQVKALAGATAVLAFWLLKQLYVRSTIISPVLTPLGGWLVALVSFFLACSLLQVSVSAFRALLVGPTALKRVPAYDVDAIASDFFLLGFRVKKLLPESPVLELSDLESPDLESPDLESPISEKTDVVQKDTVVISKPSSKEAEQEITTNKEDTEEAYDTDSDLDSEADF